MSWFSKKLKKITKVADPIGAKLRKSTGGSYGDPMNWYQSKPKKPIPYERPEKLGLQADPGTGGGTTNLGSTTGYAPNPFAAQMAQATALRQPNLAQAPGGITPTGSGFRPGSQVFQQAAAGYMAANPQASVQPPVGVAGPQQMQNTMARGGTPGMMF